MSPEYQRYLQAEAIKKQFDIDSVNVGVALEGSFTNTDNETVQNPSFQYDTISRNLLIEAKDDARIPYWRSVNNKNILLTNEQKNTLYELLKVTYFTKFAESRWMMDNL